MSKYIPRPKNIKANCEVCKKEFIRTTARNKICSRSCRYDFYGRRKTYSIASASVGSVSEMQVCCEMLKQGYSVFRTVSQSSFCDVVAIKRGACLLIEVRTGYRDLSGRVSYPKQLHNKIANPTHYGIYVPQDNTVTIVEITKEQAVVHSEYKEPTDVLLV